MPQAPLGLRRSLTLWFRVFKLSELPVVLSLTSREGGSWAARGYCKAGAVVAIAECVAPTELFSFINATTPRLRTPNGALAVAWFRPAANAACLTGTSTWGKSGTLDGRGAAWRDNAKPNAGGIRDFPRASSRNRGQKREGTGTQTAGPEAEEGREGLRDERDKDG